MVTRFKSSLFARIFATTTAAILILFAAMYLLSVPFIQRAVENIEEHSARTVLNNVYDTVAHIQHSLENNRQSVLIERKMELREIVSVVESRASWLAQQAKQGKLTREQAKQMLLDEIRQIQYGRNDYVWASDYRSVLVSHPDPKLNNADFSQQRDTRGNLIVPPMVAGARAGGEGYYSYWWRRLGEEQPIEKLTFYKHLPAFELVIGTGVYVDDIEAALENRRRAAIEELRQQLRGTRLAKTGYVYIFDSQNHVLIHPNANIEGKNFSGMIDRATGRELPPMLKAAADKPEGVRYKWDHPSDPGKYVHDKISWVRYFPGFDWYICTSVYVDELDESARTLRNRVLAVFAVTLLLSVLLIYLFVKKLTDPLRQLRDTALRVENGDFDARCNLSRIDEIGIVATAFNGMVRRLQDNIRHLDTKVVERTAELEKAYKELQELDQLKSDFLSTVSHELRTPMTSVVGFAKLTKKKLEKSIFPLVAGDEKAANAISQVRENLDIIVAESERLTLLINDVLDSAKLEAGKVEWNFVAVMPLRLIERTAAITATLIEQKGLALINEVEPDLPNVRGDENRLLQVLINLVANAVKFTERGQITLRAERQDEFVRFSVRDSGSGIAEEHWGRIFDKFKQIGDTLTDRPHGTGLGLSICQRIVQHHGGEIWLDSEPGVGSIFYVTVPIEKVIQAANPSSIGDWQNHNK
jgi:signal transduction histidine kinase